MAYWQDPDTGIFYGDKNKLEDIKKMHPGSVVRDIEEDE